MEMINPALREEIQLKFDKISGDPRYYDNRRGLVMEELRSLGDIYSFWIENPELRKALLLENKKPETIKKKARFGIRAVKDGWYFLSQIGKGGNFISKLDGDILKRLNKLVEPKISGTGDFRKKDVTLSWDTYTPPSWEKVPLKIRSLISRVKAEYKRDFIGAAILFHLGASAIQPFIEGNKRCARLVQDRILYDVGLPPAMISAGEGRYYFGLLKKTFPAYRNGEIEEQREFYDYCASKVNNGLDDILADLSD